MSEIYELEKWVWTEDDFDAMDWHDCRIYALAFHSQFEFVLDIDYIFEWVCPAAGDTHFNFWVSPATLAFENAFDLEISLAPYLEGIDINEIRREEAPCPENADTDANQTGWKWIIDCQEGEITFRSAGYQQFIRSTPSFSSFQQLGREIQGVSFERGRI